MLYDIRLTIRYDYEAPSDHSRNLFRLMPADVSGTQRVHARLLTVDPLPTERRDGRDFFGNTISSVAWHAPITAFSVALTARVDCSEDAGRFDISPRLPGVAAEVAANHEIGALSPHHFTGGSWRVRPRAELTAYAEAAVEDGMSALQVVTRVGEALYRDMRFDPEATNVDTAPEEAFAQRHGVCQDFAHIMIACLRGLGVPAGYVSGFLRTDPPEGQPRLEGADAMHAWVRAWVGNEMGWVEYDPTNGRMAGVDHITVGYGRDYDDVAPVVGAMRGMGGHSTTQAVDVVPVA